LRHTREHRSVDRQVIKQAEQIVRRIPKREGIGRGCCLTVTALVPGDAAPAIRKHHYVSVEHGLGHEESMREDNHVLTRASVREEHAPAVDMGVWYGVAPEAL
jgi:hypothetical protein